MALVILGVNNKISNLSLSNYSLAIQIVVINLFTTIIGLFFLFFFNYFLLTNNTNIQNKINQINVQMQDITNYLQNNAIIRIPQFNEENCQRSIQSDTNNNLGCGEIILSEPQLDPFSTQNYLVSKHLNQKNNIRIYNID